MFKKKRQDRERQQKLQQLNDIAEAFLKARAVYPLEYEGFLEIAGQKQVDLFCQTMYLIDQNAESIGYRFMYYYSPSEMKWSFEFSEV